MRFVPLPEPVRASSAKISVLGFGCAAFLGRASRKQSLLALNTALDHGITFFDTARSYGYGGSEALLGEFLVGKRDKVFLCTKFGIIPSAQGGWKQSLKPIARALVRSFPGLRKTAQRHAASQFLPGQFSVSSLTASFETSLRELRTDYVDMLLMHAAPASALAQDDLLEVLERLVASGKVGLAGISAELPVISEYFTRRPVPLRTAQFALNLSSMNFVEQTKRNQDLLLVANHPFGGPSGNAAAQIDALRTSVDISHELRQKLQIAQSDAQQILPEIVLNCILDGTGVSAVIPAMMQVQHIKSNVRAIESCRFTSGELALVRNLLMRDIETSSKSHATDLPSSKPAR